MHFGLIGATGLIGREVVKALLADTDCEHLRVFARKSSLSSHPKMDWRVVEFDRLETKADCRGLNAMLCALGTTTGVAGKAGLERVDHDYVVAAGKAARAAGCERFAVISAVGASPHAAVHYSRTKGRMEADLEALGFASLEILRPSLLLGQRNEHRAGEALGQKLSPLLSPLLAGPLRRYRPIHARDVAATMIDLAKRGEPGTHRRHLPL